MQNVHELPFIHTSKHVLFAISKIIPLPMNTGSNSIYYTLRDYSLQRLLHITQFFLSYYAVFMQNMTICLKIQADVRNFARITGGTS